MWLCIKSENLYQKIHFKISNTVSFIGNTKQIKTKLRNFPEQKRKEFGRVNASVLKVKLFFIPAGKNLGTSWAYCVLDKPEKLQANFSLKHCHVFSHTAPPTCAKNLSNYLSSGKPCLIISSSLQTVPIAVCQSSSQLTFLSNTIESFLQTTSAQFVQLLETPLLWGSSMAHELSGAGPAFHSTWSGSSCPHRAAALTWDSQVLF